MRFDKNTGHARSKSARASSTSRRCRTDVRRDASPDRRRRPTRSDRCHADCQCARQYRSDVNIAVVNVPAFLSVVFGSAGGRVSSSMRTLKHGNRLRELADQFIARGGNRKQRVGRVNQCPRYSRTNIWDLTFHSPLGWCSYSLTVLPDSIVISSPFTNEALKREVT